MDSKHVKDLMEAYLEIYAPQEEINEAVKGESSERRKALAAERRAGIKPLSAKEGEKYASHKISQMAYAKRAKMGEEVEQIDEISQKTATRAFAHRATGEFEYDTNPSDYTKSGKSKADESKRRIEKKFGKKAGAHAERAAHAQIFGRKGAGGMPSVKEELDIFDVVLEFLQVEGIAETLEEAQWVMANLIDEEIVADIIAEATYSAKAARVGKDIGKPGKAFAKIAAAAGKRYGSKERGEKVAGAVLAKLRAKHG